MNKLWVIISYNKKMDGSRNFFHMDGKSPDSLEDARLNYEDGTYEGHYTFYHALPLEEANKLGYDKARNCNYSKWVKEVIVPMVEGTQASTSIGIGIGPRKIMPEVPPPIWDTRIVNPASAMDVTRVMCGGEAKGK